MTTTAVVTRMSGPPATLLFNDWYPALRSELLQGKRMATTLLLGIPMVLGRRDDGRLFAMRDLCRIAASRSPAAGSTASRYLQISRLDLRAGSGQCMEIPSLTKDDSFPRNLHGMAYPCEERDGYAWVYVPEAGRGRVSPEDAALLPGPGSPEVRLPLCSAHLTADLPCNVDHGIIGLMDPAHGPFVHQSWWWRKEASIHEKEKRFEPIPQGFRMATHAPSKNSAPYKLLGVYGEPVVTTIDFVLPNRRYETIRCGDKWFSSLTTVTPTTATSCRIDVAGAWNVLYHLPFMTSILRFFGNMFVRQDQVTMIQQAQGLLYDPALMLIDDADKPAKWISLSSRRVSMPSAPASP